jgi:hypothetical protein
MPEPEPLLTGSGDTFLKPFYPKNNAIYGVVSAVHGPLYTA